MTARSVMLSVLLGTNPPRLPVAKLVAVAELFGITEGAARTALSRMVTAGDVTLENGRYRLSTRLVDRQRRQEQSRVDSRVPWSGRWYLAVVNPASRSAADRSALRQAMTGQRLGEFREGVWLRPDNLGVRHLPPPIAEQCTVFVADAPVGVPRDALVAQLWDLPAWASRAEALIDALHDTDDLAGRFMVAAATLRHLLEDPLLPDGLCPAGWPASNLRKQFAGFYDDLHAEMKLWLRN
ncbi:MAG: hypothetical protein R2749_28435 [Acidimicrobiales bacterium]